MADSEALLTLMHQPQYESLSPLDTITPESQLPGIQTEYMPPEPSHCPGVLEMHIDKMDLYP